MCDAPEHFAVACGGTGGHFYPTLAIARECRESGSEVTLLVAGQHAAEHLELAARNDLRAIRVPAVRLPGRSAALLTFPFRMLHALAVARRRLRQLRPTVVLGMGSFASVPACLAATSLRLPLVLHDGNARIGRANRFLSRWARVLATSLPVAPGQTCRCPTADAGLPLRQSVLDAARRDGPPPGFLEGLGFAADRPVLLVFGGSQGARFLNDLMAATVACLGSEAERLQVIHLTGSDDNDGLERAYLSAGTRATVRRADPHIENDYLAAGLVVCRAGASTISELALFGRPAILVPLPTAAEDHQTVNARMVATRDAARLLPQDQATPAALAALLREWLRSPQEWAALGTNLKALARPDAGEAMARLLHATAARSGVPAGAC